MIFCVVEGNAQPIVTGTFNLRYDNAADTGNLWKDRKAVVVDLIRFHRFDLLGTQEGLQNQLDDMSGTMPEYGRYGIGRDDGKNAGEHSAIFYRKDRFALLDSGDFWLSEQPEKPGKGWDATCCNRICSWVKLKDTKTKRVLWCFNAHYDHQGAKAREESSRLILEKIKQIAGNGSVIFMGDLNGGRSSVPYQRIAASAELKDSYSLSPVRYEHNPSFQAFGRQLSGAWEYR